MVDVQTLTPESVSPNNSNLYDQYIIQSYTQPDNRPSDWQQYRAPRPIVENLRKIGWQDPTLILEFRETKEDRHRKEQASEFAEFLEALDEGDLLKMVMEYADMIHLIHVCEVLNAEGVYGQDRSFKNDFDELQKLKAKLLELDEGLFSVEMAEGIEDGWEKFKNLKQGFRNNSDWERFIHEISFTKIKACDDTEGQRQQWKQAKQGGTLTKFLNGQTEEEWKKRVRDPEEERAVRDRINELTMIQDGVKELFVEGSMLDTKQVRVRGAN